MPGAIFLGGGGLSKQSAQVDAVFFGCCDARLPLIYVPNAMRSHSPEQSLAWFRTVIAAPWPGAIEMWPDLQAQCPPEAVAGIYIGGGDTAHLVDELSTAGFDRYLAAAVDAGTPIFGQSAGAIVLGEILATSSEAVAAGRADSRGLGLLAGHAVACHFRPEDEGRLAKLSLAKQLRIIAVSDDAGAMFADGKIIRVGESPVSVFEPSGDRSEV